MCDPPSDQGVALDQFHEYSNLADALIIDDNGELDAQEGENLAVWSHFIYLPIILTFKRSPETSLT